MSAQSNMNDPRDWRGRQVRFRVGDAHLPKPAEILIELHGRDELLGRISDLTDSGSDREAFAVVEVAGLSAPLVVPTRCLTFDF